MILRFVWPTAKGARKTGRRLQDGIALQYVLQFTLLMLDAQSFATRLHKAQVMSVLHGSTKKSSCDPIVRLCALSLLEFSLPYTLSAETIICMFSNTSSTYRTVVSYIPSMHFCRLDLGTSLCKLNDGMPSVVLLFLKLTESLGLSVNNTFLLLCCGTKKQLSCKLLIFVFDQIPWAKYQYAVLWTMLLNGVNDHVPNQSPQSNFPRLLDFRS